MTPASILPTTTLPTTTLPATALPATALPTTKWPNTKDIFTTAGKLILTTLLPAVVLMAVLCGCASLPDEQWVKRETAASLPEKWATETIDTEAKTQLKHKLYGLIRSTELQNLVAEAIANNQDLKAAGLRLEASRLALAEARSQRLPRIDLALNRTRNKASTAQSETYAELESPTAIEQSYSGGFGLSWELDLWGRLADQQRAAEKKYSADRWEYRAARNSLAAQVTQAWISLWSYCVLSDIEQQRLRLLQSLEQTITESYRSGLGSLEDVAVARSSAYSAKATLEQRKEQRRDARRALALLLGRYPRAVGEASIELPKIDLAIAAVPAVVMAERADIRAAFLRLQAFNAQTRAAYKALLPTINLQGGLNRASTNFRSVSAAATGWSLVADVVQPLFNGGRLINQAKAGSAEAHAELFSYQYKVLQAMGEVEDALSLELSLASRQAHYQSAYESSLEVMDDYRQRYSNGLSTILELLQVQTQTLDFKIALTEAQAERLSNRMTLGLALGLALDEE